MPSDAILVPATLPPTPLILADATFLGELAAVEKAVEAVTVVDPNSAQEAANLLRQLTTVGGNLEKTRADLKKPFLDLGRKIDEVARTVSLRIERSKSTLRTRLGEWNDREQKRIAEERRKRDEELMRLEKLREAEELAEQQRIAAMVATTAPAPSVDLDFETPTPAPRTETEARIEQLRYSPAPAAPKPAGVAFKAILKFRITNVRALPDDFKIIMANEQGIRATFCTGWREGAPMPTLPGVEFFVEKTAVAAGRSAS